MAVDTILHSVVDGSSYNGMSERIERSQLAIYVTADHTINNKHDHRAIQLCCSLQQVVQKDFKKLLTSRNLVCRVQHMMQCKVASSYVPVVRFVSDHPPEMERLDLFAGR